MSQLKIDLSAKRAELEAHLKKMIERRDLENARARIFCENANVEVRKIEAIAKEFDDEAKRVNAILSFLDIEEKSADECGDECPCEEDKILHVPAPKPEGSAV